MIDHHDDGPDLRTLKERRRDWRARNAHLIPARWRHLDIVHEWSDMFWSALIALGLLSVPAVAWWLVS